VQVRGTGSAGVQVQVQVWSKGASLKPQRDGSTSYLPRSLAWRHSRRTTLFQNLKGRDKELVVQNISEARKA
jgi:hypothetical protein